MHLPYQGFKSHGNFQHLRMKSTSSSIMPCFKSHRGKLKLDGRDVYQPIFTLFQIPMGRFIALKTASALTLDCGFKSQRERSASREMRKYGYHRFKSQWETSVHKGCHQESQQRAIVSNPNGKLRYIILNSLSFRDGLFQIPMENFSTVNVLIFISHQSVSNPNGKLQYLINLAILSPSFLVSNPNGKLQYQQGQIRMRRVLRVSNPNGKVQNSDIFGVKAYPAIKF